MVWIPGKLPPRRANLSSPPLDHQGLRNHAGASSQGYGDKQPVSRWSTCLASGNGSALHHILFKTRSAHTRRNATPYLVTGTRIRTGGRIAKEYLHYYRRKIHFTEEQRDPPGIRILYSSGGPSPCISCKNSSICGPTTRASTSFSMVYPEATNSIPFAPRSFRTNMIA
jgi:hypothetical protein